MSPGAVVAAEADDEDCKLEVRAVLRAPRQVTTGDAKHDTTAVVAAAAARRKSLLATMMVGDSAGTQLPNGCVLCAVVWCQFVCERPG